MTVESMDTDSVSWMSSTLANLKRASAEATAAGVHLEEHLYGEPTKSERATPNASRKSSKHSRHEAANGNGSVAEQKESPLPGESSRPLSAALDQEGVAGEATLITDNVACVDSQAADEPSSPLPPGSPVIPPRASVQFEPFVNGSPPDTPSERSYDANRDNKDAKRGGFKDLDASAIEMTEEEKEFYREAFDRYDEDGSGDIDTRELGQLLQECFNVAPSLQLVRDILDDLDDDSSGTLGFEEFLLLIEHYQREADKDLEKRAFFSEEEAEEYKELFNSVDKDGSGELSIAELGPILTVLDKAPRTKAEQQALAKILKAIDKDDSGSIDFNEFLQLLRRFIDEQEAEMIAKENVAQKEAGLSDHDFEGFKEVFNSFDEENRGVLGFSQLRSLLRVVGMNMEAKEADELREIMNSLDEDKDATTTNFCEFIYLIKHITDTNWGNILEQAKKTLVKIEEDEKRKEEQNAMLERRASKKALNRMSTRVVTLEGGEKKTPMEMLAEAHGEG